MENMSAEGKKVWHEGMAGSLRGAFWRPLGVSPRWGQGCRNSVCESTGKLRCVGAETGNPEQKRFGKHYTGRSAESQVEPKEW